MSVIVWDGKSLAADRQNTNSDLALECTKIQRINSSTVVAYIGDRCEGIALVHWFQDGAITADWPAFQRHDNWSRLVVAKRGKVFSYEHVAEIIPVTSEFEAWGSGRDFAIGALEMGADARKAVEIANQYNIYCGFGVDVFSTGPVVLRQAST